MSIYAYMYRRWNPGHTLAVAPRGIRAGDAWWGEAEPALQVPPREAFSSVTRTDVV